jgi:aspartate kinase
MYRQNSSSQVGVLKNALEVFEKYQISVEHVPTGIDNFSIVVSSSAIERCKYEIASNLKIACQCDSLKIAENISLIAIVGRNMASQCGAGGRLFNTLGQHGINIHMISQGSDEISIFVGVENKDFKKAIRVIYDEFC